MLDFAALVVSFLVVTAFAPGAQALPSGGLERHHHRDVPAQFQERGYAKDSDLLEPYPDYHERYKVFGCKYKHSTTFWDQCCHPLLKDEPEDDLPDICFESCDPSMTTDSLTTTTTTSWSHPPPTTTSTSSTPPSETPSPPTTTHYTPPPMTTTTTSHHTWSTAAGGGGGGDGDWYINGFGTYYTQNGNPGACGRVHSDQDLIVAINEHFWRDSGAVSPLCGKKIEIVNQGNGNRCHATVADMCPTCVGHNSTDLSVAVFKSLSNNNLAQGQFPIMWRFMS